MLYQRATSDVQAYLYKCTCQPTLTYGLECMSSTAIQMRQLQSVQGLFGYRPRITGDSN